jgi:hypothetical protein
MRQPPRGASGDVPGFALVIVEIASQHQLQVFAWSIIALGLLSLAAVRIFRRQAFWRIKMGFHSIAWLLSGAAD